MVQNVFNQVIPQNFSSAISIVNRPTDPMKQLLTVDAPRRFGFLSRFHGHSINALWCQITLFRTSFCK
jgi:hypothetical protein